MITPGKVDLVGFRDLVFADYFRFEGLNLTGAGLRMQVRLYPNADGDPLIDLEPVADIAAEEGLLLEVDLDGAIPVSTVYFNILRATTANLPVGASHEPGEPDIFSYDLVTTGTNFDQLLLVRGFFIIEPITTRIP